MPKEIMRSWGTEAHRFHFLYQWLMEKRAICSWVQLLPDKYRQVECWSFGNGSQALLMLTLGEQPRWDIFTAHITDDTNDAFLVAEQRLGLKVEV